MNLERRLQRLEGLAGGRAGEPCPTCPPLVLLPDNERGETPPEPEPSAVACVHGLRRVAVRVVYDASDRY